MSLRNTLMGILIPMFLVVLTFSCTSETGQTGQSSQQAAANKILKRVYLDEAIIMNEGGGVYSGIDEVIDFRLRAIYHIDSVATVKKVNAHADRKIDYEIQKIWTTEDEILENIIISQGRNKGIGRAFEFIAGAIPNNVDLSEIDLRRNEWVKLCNEHNAKQLVTNLYTENAVYFNHKPVVVGREKIAKEYDYMNDENYSLQLEPIIVEPVNPRIVYEIGQCSGTYNGKYFLVWQKVSSGEWQVLFDSNI